MQLETFTYTQALGWSVPAFPALDSARTLVLVFGAPAFARQHEVWAELRGAYPHSHVIGCSTSGEIHGASVDDDTLVVAVARFEFTDVRSVRVRLNGPTESYDVGRALAQSLVDPQLRSILILSDGLQVNGSDLVRGVNSVVPPSVIVTGGLAGDGARFKETWILGGSRPESGLVSAVALYGDRVQVGHGSRGGWDMFGPERRITRSRGNVLYELDGRPALQLYKDYLGERAADLPASALLFPLAIRAHGADSKVLVRTVLSTDEATQSLTFAGDVPTGSLAQLMCANFERLIEGASDAAHSTLSELSSGISSDVLSIAISCVGRRLILGERAEEETEAALAAFSGRVQQVGFYSYGEISPYAQGHCDLHNQTMTLTAICER